jgi:hypothetical protein
MTAVAPLGTSGNFAARAVLVVVALMKHHPLCLENVEALIEYAVHVGWMIGR